MKVVILCGGKGTRIRDVAFDTPKPMISVGAQPIIWHIMKYYAYWGLKQFVLCLGHQGNVIRDYFLNYEAHTSDFTINLGKQNAIQYHDYHAEDNWSVTLAETGLESMTGARVRKIQKYIGNDDYFMLTYGDGLGDIDIKALFDFHKQHGKILTVTGVHPPGRFGEMELGSNGSIVSFNEKPQATHGWISGGYFVCHRKIFDYLDANDDLILEQEPLRRLAADGEMMMFQHNGFWQPMDTYREYMYLNELVNKNEAPWTVWEKSSCENTLIDFAAS
jgi:glucose-1-phosphate cytidylyltransferase